MVGIGILLGIILFVNGMASMAFSEDQKDSSPVRPPVTEETDQEEPGLTPPPGTEKSPRGKAAGKGKEKRSAVESHDAMKEVTLDDVIVTASRKQALLKDTPASVTIINAEELEQSSLKTVDDVLRSVAGVDIWGSNLDPLGQRAVTVRGVGGGSSQERTLILVDGVPINDSWSGSVVWNQVAKEDVERIEVVRGPSSSLYGTHAMGGVINIITRMPVKDSVGGALKGTYGNLDTWSTYGNVSGRFCNGNYGYYLSGKGAGTNGYKPFGEEIPNSTNTDYQLANGMGSLYWFPDEYSYLKASASYFHEERGKGFPFSNLDPGEILRGNITYRRDSLNGISWLGILYGHGENQRHENDDRTHTALDRISKYEKPFYGFTLQPSFNLADWNILTAGIEGKYSEATQRDTYEVVPRETETGGKQMYLGFYAQDEASFFDKKLFVIPGARLDWWRSYDGHSFDSNTMSPVDLDHESEEWLSFNPKLGVVYHLTGSTSLRGSVGTGYRAPSPVELYASSNYGMALVKGNPSLEPEKILSYEIGGTQTFGKWLDVRLTLYASDVEDLIDSRFIGMQGPFRIYQKDNLSQVRARGVELETFFKITKEWYGFANYTYNESTIEEDDMDPHFAGNILAHSPLNKGNIGFTYDNPSILKGTLQARYAGTSYDDNANTLKLGSYWTLDLFLSRQLGRHFKASFDIENILDREYDIPSFNVYRSPGRLWAASLTYEF